MNYINAFWVGGVICALVQILLDKTKLLPGRVMVLLVCSGALLGALGIYDRLVEFIGDQVYRILSMPMVPVGFMVYNFAFIFLALGISIGSCGSIISMRRFLDA